MYTYNGGRARPDANDSCSTATLRTKILDFRGFDSSRILMLRGGNPMSIGNLLDIFYSRNLSLENLSRDIIRSNLSNLSNIST